MGNSLGFYVVQYLLFVFNVVFLIAGLNLMGLSVWALLDKVSRMSPSIIGGNTMEFVRQLHKCGC